MAAEPPGEGPQDREHREDRERELQVEHDEHDADARDEQCRRDELHDAVTQELRDGFDVGGLARDHSARRVPLVEREAEALEVGEHAAPDVEQDVLADATGEQQEAVERQRADRRDHEEDGDDDRERPDASAPTVEQRRDAAVDPFHDEQGRGEHARGVDGDERGRERQPPAVRSDQRRHEHAAARAQQTREAGARFLDLLGRDAAPRVDVRIAGQVERTVGVDVGNLVGLAACPLLALRAGPLGPRSLLGR